LIKDDLVLGLCFVRCRSSAGQLLLAFFMFCGAGRNALRAWLVLILGLGRRLVRCLRPMSQGSAMHEGVPLERRHWQTQKKQKPAKSAGFSTSSGVLLERYDGDAWLTSSWPTCGNRGCGLRSRHGSVRPCT